MFNSTNVNYHGGATNINVNAVSGTLVKNFKRSFFVTVSEKDDDYSRLFKRTAPYLVVTCNTPGSYKAEYWCGSEKYHEYRKSVVVIQSMIVAEGVYMLEIMWQDDFDKLFDNLPVESEVIEK